MDDLIAFLKARLDEREHAARQMAEVVWPCEVRIVPRMDTGTPSEGTPHGSIGVAEYAPKAWSRLWEGGQVDHGWGVHETAVVAWSPTLGAELLADVEAKRRILSDLVPDIDSMDGMIAGEWNDGNPHAAQRLLKLMALPYADRDDYREEWKP